MKKLCFGSLFTLLCLIKNSKGQSFLYKCLVTPYDTTDIEPDRGSVTSRKKGEDDFPQTEKDAISATTIEQIVVLYRKRLISALKEASYRKAFIVAIKDILVDDTTMPDDTEIGSPSFTKKVIVESNTFDFFVLLANLMKYCSSINNEGFETNIAEIDKTFIDVRMARISGVFLTDVELRPTSTPLELSIDPTRFAGVFTEINPNVYSLALPNPNKVKIFKLNVINKEFDKRHISDFILDNISQYVYSRTKIKNIESTHSIRTISTRAIREIERTPAFANQTQTFCEVMLYSFLECSMNAPKILSGFEINEAGRSNKYSSGIYLLPAGAISPNNQIVFGCTKAHDSLQMAVDDVLTQATQIKTNRNDEVHLLDPSVLGTILKPETADYVRSIILPSRSSSVTVDDAFGLFLTYTIDVPNKSTLSNSDYRSALDRQMDADIQGIIPYIKSQISALGLDAYSFYLFVLPLDNVANDTKAIMTTSIGGGD